MEQVSLCSPLQGEQDTVTVTGFFALCGNL
jgi:hypothetical protein